MLTPGMNLKLGIGQGGDPNADLKVSIAAYWKLEEASGNNRLDATGNGHTLTEAVPNIPSTAGVIGNGAFPDRATSQSLTTASPDDVAGGPNKVSVSFWYNSGSDAGNNRGMIGNWFYTLDIGSWAIGNFLGVIHNYVKVPGASASSYEDGFFTIPTNDSNYHHMVYVFDGAQSGNANRLKVYWDGSLQTLSFTGPLGGVPSAMANDDSILTIGQSLIGLGFYCGYKFDEVGVWNERALTQSDVTRLYNGGAGLALY